MTKTIKRSVWLPNRLEAVTVYSPLSAGSTSQTTIPPPLWMLTLEFVLLLMIASFFLQVSRAGGLPGSKVMLMKSDELMVVFTIIVVRLGYGKEIDGSLSSGDTVGGLSVSALESE